MDEPDTRPEYSPVSAILDLQAAMRRAGLDVGRHTPLGYRGPAIEAAEGLLRALGVAPTHQERPLPLAPGDGARTGAVSEPGNEDLRITDAVARVLANLLGDVNTHCPYCALPTVEGGWRYGYPLSRATGYRAGKLYPILDRLERAGLLETEFVDQEGDRPARRSYRLTAEGMTVAKNLPAAQSVVAPPRSWWPRTPGGRQ